MPAAARPSFEEGLALVMHRWTALNLAIEHGWGGTSSAAKAEELYANLLEWFYTCKGAPPGLLQPPLLSMVPRACCTKGIPMVPRACCTKSKRVC